MVYFNKVVAKGPHSQTTKTKLGICGLPGPNKNMPTPCNGQNGGGAQPSATPRRGIFLFGLGDPNTPSLPLLFGKLGPLGATLFKTCFPQGSEITFGHKTDHP